MKFIESNYDKKLRIVNCGDFKVDLLEMTMHSTHAPEDESKMYQVIMGTSTERTRPDAEEK